MLWTNKEAQRTLFAVMCACAPSVAWAQVAGGLLPALGTGYGSGDLRSSVVSVLPGAPTVNIGSRWQYTAFLGIDLGLIQTNSGDAGQSGTQFTTNIYPSINLIGDTRLLTVNLGYSPQLSVYAGGGPNRTHVSQNLNASATATVVPETLFVDVRALAYQTLRFGGTQFASNQSIGSNDVVQNYTVGASVRYQHRFREWGSLSVGYNIDRTTQADYGNNNNNNNNNSSGNGYGTLGDLTTQREFASFVTGENLNRWQYKLDANASQYPGGSGVYSSGSYENEVNNTLSYAITQGVSLFGSAGYQDIRYGRGRNLGALGYELSDITWAVGVRLTPNPDSYLSIQYGKTYGENTVQFDGSYLLTPRVRVAARYSVDVTTGIQQLQTLANTTRVGANGILLDSRTGLPVVAGTGLGSQYALSRVKQLNISAFYLLARDTFSASVINEQVTSLVASNSFNGAFVPANTASSSTVGSLSWQHDLNPVTSFNSTVSYGVIDNGNLLGTGPNSQNTASVSASLSHTFTDTLTGHVLYSYSDWPSGRGSSNSYQNVFLVGLRKTF